MKKDNAIPKMTWEQAIKVLRGSPDYHQLVYDSYLTSDLSQNCLRFFDSDEFKLTKNLLLNSTSGRQLLDMPAGNGIATYSFAATGFDVVAVEPDPSESVGRGAISRVLSDLGQTAKIINAFGESLPFEDASFDVVYVRQGLHHAKDLKQMLNEVSRVLRPNGILFACREHVVNNYNESLQSFLDSQVDHQLYGGEHAFTLTDYRDAILSSGLKIEAEFRPFDSDINIYPSAIKTINKKILDSMPGKILRFFLGQQLTLKLGFWSLNKRKTDGRLYSFLARKPLSL